MKVPVTFRSTVQRLTRKLEAEGKTLKRMRVVTARKKFGEFVVVDLKTGEIVTMRVDPVKMAREVGALRAWEEVIR